MIHLFARLLDCSVLSSAVVLAQPIAADDALEPSVCNEVAHAVSVAPTNAPVTALLPFDTNALTRTQLAVRLVSSQRADGRWFSGTNDVTYSALKILNSL